MNALGGQEVCMATLQSPIVWKATGRWDDAVLDVWFKTTLKSGDEVGLAPTHEEPLTNIMKGHIQSYKDLPHYVYQFQNKFRNELRAKSGMMRSREFVMKDLYSFNTDEASFREFYERCASAYMRIFTRVGLGDKTYRTYASGGSFSKFSDEFQTVCSTGEDTIYIHKEKRVGVNKEVCTDEVLSTLGLSRGELEETKAIEVGNIFPLGTRYSEALGLTYKDVKGRAHAPYTGCYGIGLGRLMGAIVEVLSDSKGIVWPKEVAPFQAHLVSVSGGNAQVDGEAKRLYELLLEHGIETLYDDRDVRAGEKFADSDLLGLPVRLVVSEKTMAEGGVEVVLRATSSSTLVPESGIIQYLKTHV